MISLQTLPELTPFARRQVYDLWNDLYPERLVFNEIAGFDAYLSGLSDPRHFVLSEEEKVLGWGLTFEREGARWFAIMVSETLHGRGYGKQLLNALRWHEPELNAWVIDHPNDRRKNGKPYLSPLGFYQKNGFEVLPDFRLERDIISAVKIRWRNEPHHDP